MKINFKQAVFASALLVLPFSVYSESAYSESNTITKGHTNQITKSIMKALNITQKNLKITFHEDNYKSDDNFTISNVKILDSNNNVTLNAKRMIKAIDKSIQITNIVYKEDNKTLFTVGELTTIGDLSHNSKSFNNILSLKNVDLISNSLLQNISCHIAYVNFMGEADESGIKKLNFNVKDAEMKSLSTLTQGIVNSAKQNITFYKTSSNSSDNNYSLNINADLVHGSKNKISKLKNTINIQLNNNALKSLLLNLHMSDDKDKKQQVIDKFTSTAELTTSLVSFILNFQNNDFINEIPNFDELKNPNAEKKLRELLKVNITPLVQTNYNIMTDQELTNLINVLTNSILHNKNLNIIAKPTSIMPIMNLFIRLSNKEKVLNLKISN